MDSRDLAALLPSLISELLILLLLLFPSSSSNPLLITNSDPNSSKYRTLFPLIHHLLSSSEIAASISLLSFSRKRKRTHPSEDDEEEEEEEEELNSGLGMVSSGMIIQNPDHFKLCFRMSSSTFEWLSGLLEPLLECRDPIGSFLNLSPETRLGAGLFRLSTGADYPEISRRFRVSEPIARFCAKQLCRVLCTNYRFWVGFPNPTELESVSSGFQTLTGIPNCCGFIDCARFNITLSKSKSEAEEESIAAQIVVDSSSRILSIIAGFHGCKDNSRVLKSSTLYKDIEGGKLLNSQTIHTNGVCIPQYLVGNLGFPFLPWLIVPFVDAIPGSCEEKFNIAHRLMRLSALRTVASLKSWGVLSRPIEAEFKTAVACIGACSILHNMLLVREDYSALCDEFGECSNESNQCFGVTSLGENPVEENASAIRSALAAKARELRGPRHSTEAS